MKKISRINLKVLIPISCCSVKDYSKKMIIDLVILQMSSFIKKSIKWKKSLKTQQMNIVWIANNKILSSKMKSLAKPFFQILDKVIYQTTQEQRRN